MSDAIGTTRAEIGSRIVDAIIVVALFAASAYVGTRFLATAGTRAFVEWETAPAVMLACGRGFTMPPSESPAFVDFQMRRRPAMSCADIADDRPGTPPVKIILSERYGIYGAALALRLGGLSWRALDAYVGCLFGLSMAFAYLLFRLAAGRLPSLLGVVCLVCSGHLLGLLTFRDYGKEPCFLALWLTLGWLWKRNAAAVSRKILLPAGLGGAVLGLGLGFRPDVLVAAPAFVVVIAVAVRGFRPRDVALKTAVLAVGFAAFVITGWPVLSSMAKSGNNSSHVIILGLTTSFNRTLDLEPAIYDIGSTYSDGFVYTLITAHATLVQHESQPVLFGTTRYDALGIELLADIAKRFPADVVIRALGATAQVLRYPFDPIARLADLGTEPFVQLPWLRKASQTVGSALNWLEPCALWLTLIVFLMVSMCDWRLGLSGGMLILYFCGYSMLQFSRRHTFHLDVIGIGVFVIALEWTAWLVRSVSWARFGLKNDGTPDRRPLAKALAGATATGTAACVVALTVFGTRTWQQRHVTGLLDRTLAVEWRELSTPEEPFSATVLRRGVPTAPWEVAYAAHRDQWSTAVLLRVPSPAVSRLPSEATFDIVDASYLQVEIDGRRCKAPTVLVGLKYNAFADTFHREFTRVFEIKREGGGMSRLLVPVFYVYGPYWTRFEGFAVPAAARSCITAVKRATSTEAVPLPILVAMLAPGWRTEPLYQQMKHAAGFAVPAFGISPGRRPPRVP